MADRAADIVAGSGPHLVSGTSCWAPRSTSHDGAPTGLPDHSCFSGSTRGAPGRLRQDHPADRLGHQCKLPVAWLSLDKADNDPARSWRYVVAALDRAREGLG
jgi:hypothetical protein